MARRAQPGMTVLPKASGGRELATLLARAARGLRERAAISSIQASVNGAACTARNDCATKGERREGTSYALGAGCRWFARTRRDIEHPGEREWRGVHSQE